MQKIAVLSFSGGMDSSSLLFQILTEGYDKVFCYSFDYGQRHSIEIEKSQELVQELNSAGFDVNYQLINVRDVFSDSQSAIGVNKAEEVPENEYNQENLKVTVVENRNVIFSAIIYGKALALSKKYNADVDILMGVHGNDNCFTTDTKFLTPSGLKTLSEIKIHDEIFSVNSETGMIERDEITDIVRVGTNDEIFEITTTAGVLRLTGEHKVYVMEFSNFNRENGYEKGITTKLAKDIKPLDVLIQPSNIFIDGEDKVVDLLPILEDIKARHNESFEIFEEDSKIWIARKCNKRLAINRFVDAGDFAELMAWYITEGHSSNKGFTGNNSDGSKFRAEFSQSLHKNQDKVDRIVELMKRLESPGTYQFSKKMVNDMPKEVVFYFSNITSVFMKDCGYNAYTKVIPRWLMDILISNPVAREQFIHAMILADGYSTFGTEGYCSVSNNLIEGMKELLWLSGYYVAEQKVRGRSTRYISFRKDSRKKYFMRVGDAKATKVVNVTRMQGEPVDVYDITVKNNHNFFAGSEGAMLISNSVYPDCRPESVNMAKELYRISNYGSERIEYRAPFVTDSKAQVLKAGLEALEKLGLSSEMYSHTSSCYNPHEGKACGKCATCLDRLKAFKEAGIQDPIPYQ